MERWNSELSYVVSANRFESSLDKQRRCYNSSSDLSLTQYDVSPSNFHAEIQGTESQSDYWQLIP